jgi:hypothetical protein
MSPCRIKFAEPDPNTRVLNGKGGGSKFGDPKRWSAGTDRSDGTREVQSAKIECVIGNVFDTAIETGTKRPFIFVAACTSMIDTR